MRSRFLDRPRTSVALLVCCFLAIPAVAAPFQFVSVLESSQHAPAGGSGDSSLPIITPEGRFILFASTANNLVLTSSNRPLPALLPPPLNVFLRDRTNGTTTLVSVNLPGTGGGNGDSLPSAISTNGRYALFESSASDLTAGDTNSVTDIFIRDLLTGTTRLVTVATDGGADNGASRGSTMTPDGRYVAFVSAATNLVAGDTNHIPDVFVRDLQAEVTILASVGATSTNASYGSSSETPDITPDGRYVAFFSTATNLSPGAKANGEIFVRDLVAGTTTWASTDASALAQSVFGASAANPVSFNHSISADGRFVAFETAKAFAQAGLILRFQLDTGGTDLVNTNANVASWIYEDLRSLDMTPDGRFVAFVGNTNGTAGTTTCVYLWDALSGTNTLVSGDLTDRVPTNSLSDWPTVDPTGRFVAFLSSATNLTTNALAGDYHVYVRDLQSGTTKLVDVNTNGSGGGLTAVTIPRLTSDGQLVVFECPDGGLTSNDRNRDSDVFVRDLAAGTTTLISAHDPQLPSATPNGPNIVSPSSLSADGRFVAFASDADNLVLNDTNGVRDIFVRDLFLGNNLLASGATNSAAANGSSSEPAISGDGRYVAFTSSGDNLVAGDTNKNQDVFVRDLQSGTTRLVSVSTNGLFSGNNASYGPAISAGGAFVLFRSKAANIAPGTFTAGTENLFLRNLQTSTTYALTVAGLTNASGMPAAAMTPDGRFVVFVGRISSATAYNLYLWDTQSASRVYTNATAGLVIVAISPDGNRLVFGTSTQLYALDRAASTTWPVAALSATPRVGLRFSGDGGLLVYANASAQSSPDTNAANDVYLYNWQARTHQLVSRSFNSTAAANAASDSPDISPDGRFVAFRSAATNLLNAADNNGAPDLFLFDRVTGLTSLLTASRFDGSPADNRSLTPVFSGDGRTLIFQSWASDLTALDFNHGGDVLAFTFLYASLAPGATPAQGPTITWTAVPGQSYRVQYKDNLNDLTWQTAAGVVTINGNLGSLTDLAPAAGRRFYRVANP